MIFYGKQTISMCTKTRTEMVVVRIRQMKNQMNKVKPDKDEAVVVIYV